jgi:hypothetical protein
MNYMSRKKPDEFSGGFRPLMEIYRSSIRVSPGGEVSIFMVLYIVATFPSSSAMAHSSE